VTGTSPYVGGGGFVGIGSDYTSQSSNQSTMNRRSWVANLRNGMIWDLRQVLRVRPFVGILIAPYCKLNTVSQHKILFIIMCVRMRPHPTIQSERRFLSWYLWKIETYFHLQNFIYVEPIGIYWPKYMQFQLNSHLVYRIEIRMIKSTLCHRSSDHLHSSYTDTFSPSFTTGGRLGFLSDSNITRNSAKAPRHIMQLYFG
jgi:hypothetical protein